MNIFNVLKWATPASGSKTSGDMTSTLYSEWVIASEQTSGFALAWTGTPVGAFSVELSYDAVNVDHTLTASDFSPALTAPAGSASRFSFEVKALAPYRRIKYVPSSSTGVLAGRYTERRA